MGAYFQIYIVLETGVYSSPPMQWVELSSQLGVKLHFKFINALTLHLFLNDEVDVFVNDLLMGVNAFVMHS